MNYSVADRRLPLGLFPGRLAPRLAAKGFVLGWPELTLRQQYRKSFRFVVRCLGRSLLCTCGLRGTMRFRRRSRAPARNASLGLFGPLGLGPHTG